MAFKESELEVHGKSEAVQVQNSNNCLADLIFNHSLLPVEQFHALNHKTDATLMLLVTVLLLTQASYIL